MAQPTLDSRPATWAGTSGPILYKFTSTNYSNAGYYMAVEIWNSTTAAKIADAKYYANSTGSVVVDVAPFLKSAMTLDNEADLTTGTVYTDGNWVKYYIKYREYWTASSESQVNDSSNPRWAIYGGLQLGSTNDFTDYVDTETEFLTTLGLIPEGQIGIISFKGFINAYLRKVRKKGASTVSTVDTLITNGGIVFARFTESDHDTVDSLDISVLTKTLSIGTLSTFANGGTGTNWTTGSAPVVSLTGVFETSKHLYAAMPMAQTVDYAIGYNMTVVDSAVRISYISIEALDSSFNVLDSSSVYLFTGSGVISGTTTLNTATGTVAYLAVRVQVDDLGSPTLGRVTVNSLTHSGSDIDLSETKTISIPDDCPNTIMLTWRNSLGGWESFPFTINQEYTWHYSDRKAKRLTLYADNLTLSQWEAIQGLNTLGDIYRSPITEMTTSLNRTMATIGQSVYVLNSDGTKVGVNVIGQANTTQTKQKTHSAFVTIEYPELFLQ